MTPYAYKAIDGSGRLVKGQLDAVNLPDLEQRLAALGLALIRAKAGRAGFTRRRAALSRRDLIVLCFHLEQLTRAGVPLHEALIDLRDSLERGPLRLAVAALVESIGAGCTLSEAMAAQPQAFSESFRNLIRVGEITGQLPRICADLGQAQRREDELASYARRMMIFPAIMLAVIVGALALCLAYLVPQLSSLFKSLGQSLPLHTQVLIAASNWTIEYGLAFLIGLIVAIIVLRVQIARSPRVARGWDAFLLKLPFVGPVLKKILLSRFATLFSLMYAASIPIIDCLVAIEAAIGNAVMREAIARTAQSIREGHQLSLAMADTGLFPPLIIRMIKVGESTGALDVALNNVNYFFERDVNESVAKVQAAIEPVLTLLLGLILMWVMSAVLGPVYDLLTRIKP
ncbi:MAG: hypothetical protein RIR70_1002 [Pseudomonadota bacterium]|jgi:type IV pilus assembly protein PilC